MAQDSDRGPGSGPTIPFLLFGLGRIVERELGDRLLPLGMSMRTFGVLGHLDAVESMSYSDLARRADVTVQSMHTAVRKMIADDAVRGTGSAGRSARLSITDHGRELLRRGRAALQDYESELLDGSDIAATRDIVRTLLASAWRVSAPGGPTPPLG